MSMDRISRALELAGRQRESKDGIAVAEPLVQPVLQPVSPPPARRVEFDPVIAERERILPSGAGGQNGGPYKLLRTQVLRRMDQLNTSTLAILSPTAGAGKTLTAINLAIAIAAELGRTALLVDLDLRQPSVHRRFGFEPQVGVEDCMLQDRPVHEALVRLNGYDRLSVLPARGRVETSSELLSSQRAARLVNELRMRYSDRIVIFDLPPVLLTDDALAFTKLVPAGLMVVGEGRTGREQLMRSIDLLKDVTIVGTVLNGSRDRVVEAY